jgi:hypothetical protein
MFAANLNKACYGFEPDFFKHNLVRIADDTIAVIKIQAGVVAHDGRHLLFPKAAPRPSDEADHSKRQKGAGEDVECVFSPISLE